jgi:hypothetical protein
MQQQRRRAGSADTAAPAHRAPTPLHCSRGPAAAQAPGSLRQQLYPGAKIGAGSGTAACACGVTGSAAAGPTLVPLAAKPVAGPAQALKLGLGALNRKAVPPDGALGAFLHPRSQQAGPSDALAAPAAAAGSPSEARLQDFPHRPHALALNLAPWQEARPGLSSPPGRDLGRCRTLPRDNPRGWGQDAERPAFARPR